MMRRAATLLEWTARRFFLSLSKIIILPGQLAYVMPEPSDLCKCALECATINACF